MRVSDLRSALREIGELPHYQISAPLRGAILQRFAFLTRFFRAAGYTGWVVLFDETEMISKYSVRQRGRAYAHLAQLLGHVKGVATPGLASVFTITHDYTGQVLYGRKNDLEMVPARLKGTRDEDLTGAAEIGMKTIKSKGAELRAAHARPARRHLSASPRPLRRRLQLGTHRRNRRRARIRLQHRHAPIRPLLDQCLGLTPPV